MSQSSPAVPAPAVSKPFDEKPFGVILRFATALGGLACTVIAIMSLINITLSAWANAIVACYVAPIGLVIALAEMRWKVGAILDNCPFLRRYFGRGIFYVFIGSLTLGLWKIWGWVCGGYLIAMGVFSILASMRADVRTDEPPPQQQDSGIPGNVKMQASMAKAALNSLFSKGSG
mmetsp:Transcript_23104/g.39690  ORF Transcript_23104/g.39690 Transcript_23104/m.39690 type:complete len:175 (-) Transcript_23104:632-1156(-)|eukprot:CAMPEP_0196657666 /NCGR_PEP_ID=MMETSP1086-20130531/24788_1 /TAXON_ID=77921 /ORGANISM="Cyanoptyche  gloeocystis , Strain SAG4.97" /LENGTH=174 /DNA_ID=CAMNT_0041990877 /DNA_START=29 /DNA_END=553 /DNA_ORIENTATION=-